MKIFLTLLFLASGISFSPLASAPSGEELSKRQCRSVHMRHQNIPEKSKAIYAEAEVVKSAPGTYFCAANFNDGYIGFQEKADGNKWVIFSIWDPIAHGDNPNDVPEHERTQLIAKGDKAVAKRFGGEGTGGQSFIDYDWKIGEKMKFLVIRKPSDDKFKEISGYFYDNKKKKWQLISCWKTHSNEKEFSYAVSFVEDFRRNYDSARKARGCVYGPVFAYTNDNEWVETRKGMFTGDPTPSENIRADIDKKRKGFLIQTGGDTVTLENFKRGETRELPESIKNTPPGKEVQKLVDSPLMEKAPDTSTASTK